MRATRSESRTVCRRTRAVSRSARSPAAWPAVSFTRLRSSRSANATSSVSSPRHATRRSRVASVRKPRRLYKPVNSSTSAKSRSAAWSRLRSIAWRNARARRSPSRSPFTRKSCAPARTASSPWRSSSESERNRNGTAGARARHPGEVEKPRPAGRGPARRTRLATPPFPPACKMADEAPAAQSRVSRRRRLEQRHQRPLVLEQPAFAIQAAAEAGQLAARPDHAVTGDDDGDRVLAVGGAHGASGARVAEAPRQLAVARGGAVGDGAEEVPHLLLEGRAGRVERQVERRPGAGEGLVSLVPSPGEQRAGGALAPSLPPRPPRRSVPP